MHGFALDTYFVHGNYTHRIHLLSRIQRVFFKLSFSAGIFNKLCIYLYIFIFLKYASDLFVSLKNTAHIGRLAALSRLIGA